MEKEIMTVLQDLDTLLNKKIKLTNLQNPPNTFLQPNIKNNPTKSYLNFLKSSVCFNFHVFNATSKPYSDTLQNQLQISPELQSGQNAVHPSEI